MQQAAFTEADKKRVKVVNFVAKWLNLYPHTVCIFEYHNCNLRLIKHKSRVVSETP